MTRPAASWLLTIAVLSVLGVTLLATRRKERGRRLSVLESARGQSVPGHPSVTARMRGPVPGDGRPLDAYERRILGRIEIDALIDVPEVTYSRGNR